MKKRFPKFLSAVLAAVLLLSMVPAMAADAYGQQLQERSVQLNEGTQLQIENYLSGSGGLRQEIYVTYSPNENVTPVVTYGGSVTGRQNASAAARELEEAGYRVVAGVNGDFFDSNGVPTGILVSGGRLLSSDGGNYAVGFRDDGSAVIGRPGLSLTGSINGEGSFYVAGVNKARSSSGGIYLYTYEFKAAHNTGTTDPGVEVILEPVEEACPAIGATTEYEVVEVVESTGGAADIEEGQVILSVNAAAAAWELNYMRSMEPGDTFGLTVTAADEDWNDVVEAVGGLHLLVEDGRARSGLDNAANPRTAIGVKENGDVVIYTVDGRQSGHSIGSSLDLLAQRMEELGCETAICFDGGGSTTAVATMPAGEEAQVLNRPSDGSLRAVTDCLFLVASGEATGEAGQVHLWADSSFVLAGSTVEITATLTDTNFIPMDEAVELDASDGDTDGSLFTAPEDGGSVTITGRADGERSTLDLTVVETPDEIRLYSGSSQVTSITLAPGESLDLTASAIYRRLEILSSNTGYDWEVSGDVGEVTEDGVFTAGQFPASGTLTVSAGRTSLEIPVTVSTKTPRLLEGFEGDLTGLTGTNAVLSAADSLHVHNGWAALRMDYTLTAPEDAEEGAAGTASVAMALTIPSGYDRLTAWVWGDGSGNTLALTTGSGQSVELTALDFTGWRQVTAQLPSGTTSVTALTVSGQASQSGTLYLDQLVAAYEDAVDSTPPVITGSLSDGVLTATVTDAVDGTPAASQLTLTCDGQVIAFQLDSAAGAITADLSGILSDGGAHRITLSARDQSGNLIRASWDVARESSESPFPDLTLADGGKHWAADYVNYFYLHGVVTGVERDGEVYAEPDRGMTRAEFAVMIYRWLGLNASDYAQTELPFSDAGEIESWALDAARAMYAEGIMQGTGRSDGTVTFDPDEIITRAQAMTMLGRLQERGYVTASLEGFSDSADVPDWAAPYLETMYAQGILSGSDGRLEPNAPMTRGQACKVLYMLW